MRHEALELQNAVWGQCTKGAFLVRGPIFHEAFRLQIPKPLRKRLWPWMQWKLNHFD